MYKPPYTLTLSEIMEAFYKNKDSKTYKFFSFQGENFKKGVIVNIDDNGFLSLQTFEKGENFGHKMVSEVKFSLTAKNFLQKYQIVESLGDIF